MTRFTSRLTDICLLFLLYFCCDWDYVMIGHEPYYVTYSTIADKGAFSFVANTMTIEMDLDKESSLQDWSLMAQLLLRCQHLRLYRCIIYLMLFTMT